MTAPWTWHGGGLAAAKRRFGEGIRPWLDLSTGINPHGWPHANALAIDWQRLPETTALAELEATAARYFRLAPHHVCAVPGTEIGLRLIGQLAGGPARYLAPAYRTHSEMIPGASGASLDGMGGSRKTLILANPTNPDGRSFDRDTLTTLLARRDAGAWLLLDEAFADPIPELSLAGQIDNARRLVIFRSFGKFFGLAGVRLGFVLGPQNIIEKLRMLLGAWPLSTAAIAIGTAAYSDAHWINATRTRLYLEAASLDAVLAELGYRTIGTCPLFRLIEVEQAVRFFERLASQAILTRPFADHPRWLRIGLPADAEALARLRRALANG